MPTATREEFTFLRELGFICLTGLSLDSANLQSLLEKMVKENEVAIRVPADETHPWVGPWAKLGIIAREMEVEQLYLNVVPGGS